MGSLAACILAGVPKQLVIPCLPHNASFGGKGHGKAPASYDPVSTMWGALDEWQLGGLDGEIQRAADTAGGNAGLILGAPYDNLQFVAVDIDLEDGPQAVKWRNGIIAAFGLVWGQPQPLTVRETVPYRAMLLVNLPPMADPGAKKRFTIYYPDPARPYEAPVPIGKIELLTRGQQAVVGGTHASGNPIRWYRTDKPDEKFDAPPIAAGLPTFADFEALTKTVVELLDSMTDLGFTYSALSANGTGGPAPPIAELAPPSVDDLVTLIDQMPNPREVDRDIYASVMLSISGCRAGLIAIKGALSAGEENRIGNAAAGWAARWSAPANHTAGSLDEERAKWDADWVRPREDHHAGWRHLLNHAMSFGAPDDALRDIAMQQAQDQFTADPQLLAAPASLLPAINSRTPEMIRSRMGVDPSLARESDSAISDEVQNFIGENCIWLAGDKQWLVWDGDRGWKAGDTAGALVRSSIEVRLWHYVKKFGSGDPTLGIAAWGPKSINRLLSAARLAAVESLLQTRLSKSVDEVNLGTFMLQTPDAAYDLRTMERLSDGNRKRLFDTRCTAVSPDPHAATPYWFDSLTLNLCNGDKAIQDWLLHYLGYSLLGKPSEDCFVVICGPGGNGKSRLIISLRRILADYAVSLDPTVLLASGKDKHPASLNRIRHKRLALVSELPTTEKWNEQMLKKITGADEIEARDMGKNPSVFQAESGLLIVANDVPRFDRVDPAIVRRFRLINTYVTPAKRVKDLEDIIAGPEGPAVLWLLMTYAQKVILAGGLPEPPDAMLVQTKELLASGDMIFAWLTDECEVGPDVQFEEESVGTLRKRCEAYIARTQKEQGEFAADKLNPKDFLNRLRKEGVVVVDEKRRVKKASGNFEIETIVRGIRLKVKVAA